MKKTLLLRLVALVAILLPISATSQITSFPHTEDFETFNTCTNSCAVSCALGNGWTNGGTRDWRGNDGTTSSTTTGPSMDHNPGTGSGVYLYAETSSPCNAPTATNVWEAISPAIDLTGANAIQFEFWWHAFGTTNGNLHVDVTTDGGTTWTNDIIPSMTDDLDQWQHASASLGAFTGLVNVRLRYEGPTGYWGDLAIDDILIYDLISLDAGISAFVNPVIPTCVFNDTVTVELTNFGTDTLKTVNIEWSHNGTAQTTLPWTGSLEAGASTTVFLGTVAYANGSNLSANTNLPNGVSESVSGAANDTTQILGLSTGLSGTYTIGGATPDYVDFASAVGALSSFGTCGPVVFDVRDGAYTEQISLVGLSSMDANNTVTFRSENGDASLVTISHTATGTGDNFVINLEGASHYRFENLTLESTATTNARIVNFTSGCNENHFVGCHMISPNVTSTSTNAALIYSNADNDSANVFLNNILEGGSYGMYYYGPSSASGEAGTVIEGNHFFGNRVYGARLYYQDGLIFKNNVIDGPSSYTATRYGLYLSNANKGPQITGNRIVGDGSNGWNYGVYWLTGGGTPAITGLFENNMINAGYPSFTTTGYGIYMSSVGYMNINHNTIHFTQGGSSARAFYPASGGGNVVKNNIFSTSGSGYAIYAANAFVLQESDYNVLHAPAGNVGYMGSAHATLADWQNATGFDANSIDKDPMFYSDIDLHICNDSIGNQGTPLPAVTVDNDGQLRSTVSPDMGADEFTGLVGSFLGPDVEVCVGDSVMISAGSPTDTIMWNTGDTTSFIWVNSPGSYSVTINSACGTGTDSVVVSTSALSYTNYVVASELEFCTGDSVLLYSSQMANSYQWSLGSTATTDSIYATTGGAYTLSITDACGSGSETITLVENSIPTPTFTYNPSFLTSIFTNTTLTGANPSYLWDFGDGTTSTLVSPTHIYGVSGWHVVTLTVTNDCGSASFSDSILLAVQSIDEILVNGDVSVYPNPSNGEFTIDMELISNDNVSFRVENLIGAVVYESNPIAVDGAHTETISLKNVPTGVYFVNIQVGENKLVKKLIIE